MRKKKHTSGSLNKNLGRPGPDPGFPAGPAKTGFGPTLGSGSRAESSKRAKRPALLSPRHGGGMRTQKNQNKNTPTKKAPKKKTNNPKYPTKKKK